MNRTSSLDCSTKFFNGYRNLVGDIDKTGEWHTIARNGSRCKVARGMRTLTYDIIGRTLPVLNFRKMFLKTAVAEASWILSGSNRLADISKYTRIWDKFAKLDDDGTMVVENAYGPRLRSSFGRDQLVESANLLATDLTSRHNFVSLWDPSTDGLGNSGNALNIPCPVSLEFSCACYSRKSVRATVVVRSSDVILGLPYDFMMFTMLAQAIVDRANKMIAKQPGKVDYIRLSSVEFVLINAHFYENQAEVVDLLTWADDYQPVNIKMPGLTLKATNTDKHIAMVMAQLSSQPMSDISIKAQVVV